MHIDSINADDGGRGGSGHQASPQHGTGYGRLGDRMHVLARKRNADGLTRVKIPYGTALFPTHFPRAGSQASDRGKVQRKILMKQVLGSGGGAGEERPQAEPAREAGLSEALTAVVKDTSDRVKSVARLVKVLACGHGVDARVQCAAGNGRGAYVRMMGATGLKVKACRSTRLADLQFRHMHGRDTQSSRTTMAFLHYPLVHLQPSSWPSLHPFLVCCSAGTNTR